MSNRVLTFVLIKIVYIYRKKGAHCILAYIIVYIIDQSPAVFLIVEGRTI
jgi:hypothetical protein